MSDMKAILALLIDYKFNDKKIPDAIFSRDNHNPMQQLRSDSE